MARMVLGVVAGFLAWASAWFGGERVLSALWPERFGTQQLAFQAALEHGSAFTADTTFLLLHIALGAIVSAMAGFLAVLIAGENKRTPLVLGCVLLALGLLKAGLSWPYVPLWYHVVFTGLLVPMTMLGGKLRSTASMRFSTEPRR